MGELPAHASIPTPEANKEFKDGLTNRLQLVENGSKENDKEKDRKGLDGEPQQVIGGLSFSKFRELEGPKKTYKLPSSSSHPSPSPAVAKEEESGNRRGPVRKSSSRSRPSPSPAARRRA